MNIHEYQSKELLKKFNVPIPAGVFFKKGDTVFVDENVFDRKKIVIKAQIHAGGRGKGSFIENGKSGIQFADSPQEAQACANTMLGNTLVTKQTGPAGKIVNTVYLTEAVNVEKEFYLAILVDRDNGVPVVIASAEGGTEIEVLAVKSPEKIVKTFIDPAIGIADNQARKIAFAFGLTGQAFKDFIPFLKNLYKLFIDCDASLVEINPLVLTKEGAIIAVDAKIQLDDNALFKHQNLSAMRDFCEEDQKEVAASKFGLNYIALDGNIACLVNGAGLAMATMDIIKHYGGLPANFLDVGGSAKEDQVREAFKIILTDKNVKGILVNVFGGILHCDIIARGIVEAAKSINLTLPLVVRLQGTNVDAAKEILKTSGLKLISVDGLADAAKTIIEQIRS